MNPFEFFEEVLAEVTRHCDSSLDAVSRVEISIQKGAEYITKEIEYMARDVIGDKLKEERDLLERMFKK